MKIIRPHKLGPAQLVSSNVPEDDAPAWSSQTSYSTGDTSIVNHRVYEALTPTQGDNPPDNPDKWLDTGATNRWQLVDDKVSTSTESDAAFTHGTGNGIQVEFTPGALTNGVALFGVYGGEATLEVIDPLEGLVYSRTTQLVDNSGVYDFYTYCFLPIEPRETLVFLDLPQYGTANVRITITSGSEPARCGQLVMGLQHSLGDLIYGTGLGMMDFSDRDRDEFGNLEIQERDWSRSASYDVAMPAGRTDYNYKILTRHRQNPLVWIGSVLYTSSIIYGVFDDWQIVLSDTKFSDLSLKVEGLV